VDRYALVMYEALEPTCVLIFARESPTAVCQRLGKRHPNQDTTLQITPRTCVASEASGLPSPLLASSASLHTDMARQQNADLETQTDGVTG
jgi:hypothetical protein